MMLRLCVMTCCVCVCGQYSKDNKAILVSKKSALACGFLVGVPKHYFQVTLLLVDMAAVLLIVPVTSLLCHGLLMALLQG